MALRVRLCVRLLEQIFRSYNSEIVSEMLTEILKTEKFTDISLVHRNFRKGDKKAFSLSFNSDSTRWNQRWVSAKSYIVLKSLPVKLERLLATLIKSWSYKYLFMNKHVELRLDSIEKGEDAAPLIKMLMKYYSSLMRSMAIKSSFFQASGRGVAFNTSQWTVLKKVVAGKGVWVRLKGLVEGCAVWVGSAHFTPGCTHAQYEQEVSDFLREAPAGRDPVFCQVDANAPLGWTPFDSVVLPVGKDGKANEILGQLEAKGFRVMVPPKEQFEGTLSCRYSVFIAAIPQGEGYRDPEEVKMAIARARESRTKQSWCEVRRLRKLARRKWEHDRVSRAAQGDWAALAGCKDTNRTGWEHAFAASQTEDPHKVVHNHLEQVYKGERVMKNEGQFEGDTKAFTEEEFDVALGQMKGGKSVGIDGTSKELFLGLVDVPGGKQHVLEFFNRVLVTHDVPHDWNVPLMVLLPKIAAPKLAKDLRPISMGSAASKLFSRLLLNRTLQHITARAHSQCAGTGRQASDYMFTIWRVLELEREWHAGLCLVKLDVAKAFDNVNREKLLARLKERMGDCSELRCWRALLQESSAFLQSPWGSSQVTMSQGIKQGGVESPGFFAMLAEICLQETAARFRWHEDPEVFEGFPYNDVLFMDDGILWAKGADRVERRVRQLMVVLGEYGLRLNGSKCQFLCSPHWKGRKSIVIAGETVPAVQSVEVMGIPMRVGMTPCELVGPLLSRARAKFWTLKHIFRSRTLRWWELEQVDEYGTVHGGGGWAGVENSGARQRGLERSMPRALVTAVPMIRRKMDYVLGDEVAWMQRRGKQPGTPDEPDGDRRRRTAAWRAEVAARWHELGDARARARAYRRLFATIVQEHGLAPLLFAEQVMNPVWEMAFPSWPQHTRDSQGVDTWVANTAAEIMRLYAERQPRPTSSEPASSDDAPHPAAGMGDLPPAMSLDSGDEVDTESASGETETAGGVNNSGAAVSGVLPGADGTMAGGPVGPDDAGSHMDVAVGAERPAEHGGDDEDDECTLMDRGDRVEAAERERAALAGATSSDTPVNVDFTVFPDGPRDMDQGGPFIPDDRAEYMSEVLKGYSTQEQVFMLWYVEGSDRDGDDENTVMLQLWSLQGPVQWEGDESGFVQTDMATSAGLVQRLQRALEESQPGVARLRAENIRARLARARGICPAGSMGSEILSHVDALCVAMSSSLENEVADGFAARADEVDEWAWHWQAIQREVVPHESTAGPASSSLPSVVDSSPRTVGADVDSPVINEMAEEERLARCQREEEEAHVERFLRELLDQTDEEAERARMCQAWDDWALYDEMHNRQGKTRKRRFVELSNDEGLGSGLASSGSSVARLWLPPHGDLRLSLRMGFAQAEQVMEDGDSNADTVLVPVGEAGQEDSRALQSQRSSAKPSCDAGVKEGVPLEFDDFQRLFDRWREGGISNEEVSGQFGQHTLDLLQTQMAVLQTDGDSVGGLPGMRATTETILDALVESGGPVSDADADGCEMTEAADGVAQGALEEERVAFGEDEECDESEVIMEEGFDMGTGFRTGYAPRRRRHQWRAWKDRSD
ncbi:R1A1-element\ORF2 [Symbiodinium sp. CCMP2456]|nr:R1A1-element\ORF2 [Symbiodinium sp. CCMP2456]